MIEILNICLHQNSIFIKIFKIHEIFCENPRIIFVLFYDVYKENMFTINLEDRREAPFKASKKNHEKQILFCYILIEKTNIFFVYVNFKRAKTEWN